MSEPCQNSNEGCTPVCPSCGSTEFYVDGFVGYRQPYDAATGEYGVSEPIWEEDYATAAVCAQCENDATELFRKFQVLTFYTPRWRER
jgi:hypothetical protein